MKIVELPSEMLELDGMPSAIRSAITECDECTELVSKGRRKGVVLCEFHDGMRIGYRTWDRYDIHRGTVNRVAIALNIPLDVVWEDVNASAREDSLGRVGRRAARLDRDVCQHITRSGRRCGRWSQGPQLGVPTCWQHRWTTSQILDEVLDKRVGGDQRTLLDFVMTLAMAINKSDLPRTSAYRSDVSRQSVHRMFTKGIEHVDVPDSIREAFA